MWAVILRGLPLGVTSAALQRCIEEALNERPVFPQTPKIVEDEALVYLPARDIQIRLASQQVKLRCGGTVVKVAKVNRDTAQQWVKNLKPEKKKNPAPESNIHKYLKQQKREQRKLNKRKQMSQSQRNHSPRNHSPPGYAKQQKQKQHSPKSNPNLSTHHSIDEIMHNDSHSKEQYIDSLYDELPAFYTDNPNSIIWFQYLIFVTRKKTPFYVTYPAEWCWDIEGQWLKFQEHYAINPVESEKVDSRFSIGEPSTGSTSSRGTSHKKGGQGRNSHSMVGDLLNMRVTDNNTGHQYEFKRSDRLVGTLLSYGQIQFERYYRSKEKEIFLYDRKTGYHNSVASESEIKCGSSVVFEAWWNKDDNDMYHYDVTDRISSGNTGIHFEIFAFNVRGASAKEKEALTGSNKVAHDFEHKKEEMNSELCNGNDNDNGSLPLNPLLPCAMHSCVESLDNTDPLIADDFRGQRFDGLLISLNRDTQSGLIVTLKHAQTPQYMSLVFNTRFMSEESDRFRLSVNQLLSFGIGVNPENFGQGLYGYVAIDIRICDSNESYMFPMSALPPIAREFKGKIVVTPTEDSDGFVYNECENNMCRININDSHELDTDLALDMCVRYNEAKIRIDASINMNESGSENSEFGGNTQMRDEYRIMATDLVIVRRESEAELSKCYASDNFIKYRSKAYVRMRKLKQRASVANSLFLLIKDSEEYSDLYCIVSESETYVNAFLNSTKGGKVLFGVRKDGTVIGVPHLSGPKREYVRYALQQRIAHFRPSVADIADYYTVEFKPLCDCDGYVIVDAFVVIVNVSRVNGHSQIKFSTAQGQIYDQLSDGTLTVSIDDQTSNLYSGKSGKKSFVAPQIDVLSYPKPEFVTLSDIDSDESESESNHSNESESNHSIAMNNESNNVIIIAEQPQPQPIIDNQLRYTTPHLNSKPIPPNTEQGRGELAQRVQLKLNAMMAISTAYMIDPRWQSILTMASSNLYNAQKTTWMLMKNLETEKMSSPSQVTKAIKSVKSEEIIIKSDASDLKSVIETPSIGQKYAASLSGAEPDLDSYGLPILPDKSKYKAVAMEYCQKMGWKRPVEAAQCVGAGYRATVTFGKPGKEKSASGDGLRQKNAIYEAYIKLVPCVIPKNSAIELMIKWVPGYKKQEKVSTATIAQSGQSIMKHPKSVLLEWAQKNSIAPPKTIFSEFADSTRNMRIWTAKVTFCGKTIESKGSKKKDAESKCFQELLKHVMNGGIAQHKQ